MEYIVCKRFKNTAICGDVNISASTEVQEQDGIIYLQDQPICLAKSQNAHDYFARNDDGHGLERGKLTTQIMRRLAKHDDHHQDRWDRIWDDELCQQYKRPEHPDFWQWNHNFFNAPISDLEHIWGLIRGI